VKALKRVAVAIAIYVAIVVAFESLIGVFQPTPEGTLMIATTGEDGDRHERVLSGLEVDGKLYVAANHWPRAWYEQALRHPEVELTRDGERSLRRAVQVSPAEHDRLEREAGLPLVFRFLTGFPPRHFLRLDPRGQG
jgi:hypothetical protein